MHSKVTAAFKQLRSQGVIARQSFSCCEGCGSGELATLVNNARAKGKNIKGGVFYHQQDTQSFKRYGVVYIGFGSAKDNPSDEEEVMVGTLLSNALKAQGLTVVWDGSSATRVLVRA